MILGCRGRGAKLVHPGALRALSLIAPEQFPAHPNWLMSQSHFAFLELFPTIDHLIPVARGGVDDESNWVTTSMLRDSAKAHWMLDELGWTLSPPGDYAEWDGLSGWFVDYVGAQPELMADKVSRTMVPRDRRCPPRVLGGIVHRPNDSHGCAVRRGALSLDERWD